MVRTGNALAVIAFIAASIAMGADVRAQVPVPPLGSIGAPHDKNLAELLDKNQPDDAARYWGENRSYFWDNAEQNKALLARLKSAVNTPHEARMAEDAYRALPIAIDDSLRSERFISLDGALNEVVQVYVASAPAAFAQYDHFGNPAFARTYPVDVPDE